MYRGSRKQELIHRLPTAWDHNLVLGQAHPEPIGWRHPLSGSKSVNTVCTDATALATTTTVRVNDRQRLLSTARLPNPRTIRRRYLSKATPLFSKPVAAVFGSQPASVLRSWRN